MYRVSLEWVGEVDGGKRFLRSVCPRCGGVIQGVWLVDHRVRGACCSYGCGTQYVVDHVVGELTAVFTPVGVSRVELLLGGVDSMP